MTLPSCTRTAGVCQTHQVHSSELSNLSEAVLNSSAQHNFSPARMS